MKANLFSRIKDLKTEINQLFLLVFLIFQELPFPQLCSIKFQGYGNKYSKNRLYKKHGV